MMEKANTLPKSQRKLRELLMWVYDSLYAHYGPQHWWPADTRFEIIVGAILTQSMAWSNVEKAIANLKAASVLDPERLSTLKRNQIAKLIRPAGYYNAKARKIKEFLRHLKKYYQLDFQSLLSNETELIRQELLSIYGIGPETADSILLYAGNKPLFVVDNYTKRMFSRMGVVPVSIGYSQLQSIFMCNLPRQVSLFQEYHALIVRHSKARCEKQKPLCRECPVVSMCHWGSQIIRLR